MSIRWDEAAVAGKADAPCPACGRASAGLDRLRDGNVDRGTAPVKSAPGKRGLVMGPLNLLKGMFREPVVPSGPRRLDGRSKALLTASLGFLRAEEPGWITMQEAKRLFSCVGQAAKHIAGVTGAHRYRAPLIIRRDRHPTPAHSPPFLLLSGLARPARSGRSSRDRRPRVTPVRTHSVPLATQNNCVLDASIGPPPPGAHVRH
jgi:hypothetical protein